MVSIVVQFGILIGLISLVAIPMVIADQLGLPRPWPTFIGFGSLITLMIAGYSWLLIIQRKERKVLSTSNHSLFGAVRHLQNHWEATVDLSPYESIEVRGNSQKPTVVEEETFIALKQRLPGMVALVPNEIRSMSPTLAPLATDDLHLDDVFLSSTAVGKFDLGFSLPKYEQEVPWGITVSFTDFVVDDVSDNH
jgi:hypothetical protein